MIDFCAGSDLISNKGERFKMAQLVHDRLATYKDSLQHKVEWEDKDLGWGIKTRLPRLYQRELEHNLMVTVTGPTGLENQAKECLNAAAAAGLIAAVAAAFVGAGLGALGVGGKAFIDSVAACLTAKAAGVAGQIEVKLDDQSHWTDWHPG